MDEVTITNKSDFEGRWSLEDLEKPFTWAIMRFKPTKSKNLVFRRCKLVNVVQMSNKTISNILIKPYCVLRHMIQRQYVRHR